MKAKYIKQALVTLSLITSSLFAHAEQLKGDIHVTVKGMVCAFCVQGLTKTFKKLPEVEKVHVSLEEKFVHLTLKKDQTLDSEKILELIKEAGYEGTIGH